MTQGRIRGVKRRRVLIVLAVLFFASVIGVVTRVAQSEPRYQGRKLSEWLEIYRDGQTSLQVARAQGEDTAWSEKPMEEARSAVRHIGTNGLPWLERWALRKAPSLRERLGYRGLAASWNGPFSPDLAAEAAQHGYEILGLTNGVSGK